MFQEVVTQPSPFDTFLKAAEFTIVEYTSLRLKLATPGLKPDVIPLVVVSLPCTGSPQGLFHAAGKVLMGPDLSTPVPEAVPDPSVLEPEGEPGEDESAPSAIAPPAMMTTTTNTALATMVTPCRLLISSYW